MSRRTSASRPAARTTLRPPPDDLRPDQRSLPMRNRVFFPQASLDEWLGDGRVDLKNDELLIKNEGRRYRIIEATRILREVTGSDDPHELLGKVKSRAFLNELGAEILETSMIIGDNAYDIVPGFV